MEYIDKKAHIFDGFTVEMCDQIVKIAEKCIWEKCSVMGMKGAQFKPQFADKIMLLNAPFLLDKTRNAIGHIKQIAADFVGEPITRIYGSSRIMRYSSGQYIPRHQDGAVARYSHRKATALVYLTDHNSHGLVGGGTSFDEFSALPRRGRTVIFRSNEYHSGIPVISGIKYSFALFMGNEKCDPYE